MSSDPYDHGDGTPELPPTNAPLLTVAEAAALLGVSPGTVYGAIKRGDLRAFSFGTRRGTYRIEPGDLAAYKGRCSTTHRLPLPRSPGRSPTFRHLDASRLATQWCPRRERS